VNRSFSNLFANDGILNTRRTELLVDAGGPGVSSIGMQVIVGRKLELVVGLKLAGSLHAVRKLCRDLEVCLPFPSSPCL
jgi:hypothetical protein